MRASWGPKKKIRPSCNFLKVLTPVSSKANQTPIRSSWDSIQPWPFVSKFHSKPIGTIELWHEFFWASHPTPLGCLGFYQTLDKVFQNFFQSLLGASNFFIKPFGHPMEALHGQDGFLSTLWGFLSNPIRNLSKPSRILSNPEHLFFQISCEAHWACMAFTGFFFSEAKKNLKPLYNFWGPLTPNSSKSIQKPLGSHCVPGGSNGCVHWAPSMHLTMYMILHQTFGASLQIFFGHNGTQWTHRLPLVEGVFTFNYRIYTKIFSIFFFKTFFCFDSGLPKFSTGSVWPPAPPIFLVVSEYLGHHFFLWLVGYSICCPTTTFGS